MGRDFPDLDRAVIAGAGKAEVQMRQRIGRGLRAKASGPNVAFVADFVEAINNTLRDHQKERLQIVQSTPGFGERIVADFDYSVFAKKAA